ncbi:hypothetical protein [Absidia glauca]|uniref:Ndc10 domain-containing protein n=1 Tax=Absidia glauca TaxID=4829 RepID=A0A163J1T7_ABSGL|nr:hypothetical protein [Absidia glauca]
MILLIGNRLARPSLLLVSGPTRRRISIAAHQLALQEAVPGDRQDRLAGEDLSPNDNDPIQPTAAANASAQVIMMLRKTFIQDSVLMTELHPCYPIWQHSICSDPVYLPFKR